MDRPFVVAEASDVRSLIAHLFLKSVETRRLLGTITLAPHQMEAVARLKLAFEEFGGAFLCDAVGSGKTYVALALAREAEAPAIIAPAGLREMWIGAMEATGIRARLFSTEALSRSKLHIGACDALIVDEAHHFRNASTKRYAALARAARRTPTLFVTATPIHNSRRDFESLAAIFLGARARHLSPQEMARLVIRREQTRLGRRIPRVRATEWIQIRDDATTIASLENLPPPVPERDAGEAAALVTHGLIRQWASSEAALAAALKRRRARAAALQSALESGEHPSMEELRSWILGDDAIQLGFPGMFATDALPDLRAMLTAVREHLSAVTALSNACRENHTLDDDRASALLGILRAHQRARIVAFSSYEATVNAMYERLAHVTRAACLTSSGARVAGGRISRAEAMRQFDPAFKDATESDRIDLLLTTDLLSEGVNLQRAQVVVHLDIPWTAARLEQRIGRIARVGSSFESAFVFGLKPPASAERALRAASRVSSKWMIAGETVGTDHDPGLASPFAASQSTPQAHEALRALLRKWNRGGEAIPSETLVAAVRANRNGFLALIENGSSSTLICDSDSVTDLTSIVLSAASEAEGSDARCDEAAVTNAFYQMERWLSRRRMRRLAGIDDGAFLCHRRKLFARIESLASDSAPHARIRKAEIATRIRDAATATIGVEDERQLMAMHQLDSEGVERWAGTTGSPDQRMSSREDQFRIRALLLLVAPTSTSASDSLRSNTAARSPTPPAPRDPPHR